MTVVIIKVHIQSEKNAELLALTRIVITRSSVIEKSEINRLMTHQTKKASTHRMGEALSLIAVCLLGLV
jgi:hypothetical protein